MTTTLTTRPGPVPSGEAPDELRPRIGAWWLHPAWTALLAGMPGLLIAWALSDDTFRRWWRTPKHLDTGEVLLTVLLLGCFVAGTMLPPFLWPARPGERRAFTVTGRQRALLRRAGLICFTLTTAGYCAWLAIAVLRGLPVQALIAALDPRGGPPYELRPFLEPVAGVTTLTQFGPVAVTCLLLHRRLAGGGHLAALAVITVLVLVRTVLDTERLSLIETLMPAIVLAAALAPTGTRRPRTWPWALAPLAAPLALAGVFATFEYARSWTSFYRLQGDSGYLEFVVQRLAGYYATAYNNSAIVLEYVAPSVTFPHFTVQFLWNLPVVSTLWPAREVFGFEPGPWVEDALIRRGNPEFTNVGGVLGAVADYGPAGAALWWALTGVLLGLCYWWLRRGELRGLVLYAVAYAGLADIARIFYWGEGRAFPALAGAVVVAVLLHRARERE